MPKKWTSANWILPHYLCYTANKIQLQICDTLPVYLSFKYLHVNMIVFCICIFCHSFAEMLIGAWVTAMRNFISSQFLLGENSDSYGSEYEDGCRLACCAVKSGRNWPSFQVCLLLKHQDEVIALMMEAESPSETSAICTKLHGATCQTTAIFIFCLIILRYMWQHTTVLLCDRL
jgi:hypothetical protein